MRPTRALISQENFLHNLRYVRSRIGTKPLIMAVVKANAYGHGLEIIAKASIESGEVSYFGVATEEEGIALRGLFIINPEGELQYSVVNHNNIGRDVDETLRVLQALQTGGLCPANWKPGQATL